MVVFAYFNKFSPDLQMNTNGECELIFTDEILKGIEERTRPVSIHQLQFIKDRIKASGYSNYIENYLVDQYGVFKLEELPAYYYREIIEAIDRE